MTPQDTFELALSYYNGTDNIPRDYLKAYDLFLEAAEAGCAEAMGVLGTLHCEGIVVAKDYHEAFRWFMGAAEHNLPDAQNNVAYMLKSGEGVEQNLQEAIKWYKLAAEQGHSEAQCDLAELYQHGNGVEQNFAEAKKWYELAADQGHYAATKKLKELNGILLKLLIQDAAQGDKKAQFRLGYKYHHGDGVKRDHVEAIKWYTLAAEQGHVKAQFNLAHLYLHGRSVKHDIIKGVKWHKAAAEQGDANAQYFLAQSYYRGIGIAQDYKESAKWFNLAAEQGIAGAQYYIAMMHEAGLGVEKDLEKAINWYKLSAEKEYPGAMRRMGNEYYSNHDYEKAYTLYQKAANSRKSTDIDSILMLADMHLSGLGCEKDKAKAIEWLRLAAHRGSELAKRTLSEIHLYSNDKQEYLRLLHDCKDIVSQLSLAELYLRGKYVSQDTYKAISIWKGIANQGYKCAHYNLAQAYYFGIGVRRDIAKAINYLDEVIDFDLNAAAFRDIITQTGNRIISSPVFRTELKGCFKVGSILEAEWKYIYAKSNYKGQAYLDALSEVIDIYKSHPSKDSYFWLARLYRELNINSDYIQSEYYFEKAIANGHTYAKYIKSIHEDEDIHYSEYNLYLPFSYNDIIYNDFINSVEGSFKPMKGLQLSDLSDLPTKDRIPELPYIYIAHLVLNGCASLKEIDEIKDQISIWLRKKCDIDCVNNAEKLFFMLSKRDKEELREELLEYIWDVIERKKRGTTSFPNQTFYDKLSLALGDSKSIILEGKGIKNLIKYLSNDGKDYYSKTSFLRGSFIGLLPELIMNLGAYINLHDWSPWDKLKFDSVVYNSYLSSLKLSKESQLAATDKLTYRIYKTEYDISKFIILVNSEYCSSIMTRFHESRTRLIKDSVLEVVIELDKSTFADVDTCTALLVLNLDKPQHEVKFIKDDKEIVVSYSELEKNEYILKYDIYSDPIFYSEDKAIIRICDLIEPESINEKPDEYNRNISNKNITFTSSLLYAVNNTCDNCTKLLVKYDNGIKIHMLGNDESYAHDLDTYTLNISKNASVIIEYLVYLLLSSEFQSHIDNIVDKKGHFILSDLLYKKIAIHHDKNIQKQIVEDAMIRERRRFGSGVEFNVVILSENTEVIDAFGDADGITLFEKNQNFEEIYNKHIKDDSKAIIDAIVIDKEHDEYEDVMEEFGSIRDRNIHIYIISREGDKAVKGKKKVEYFINGNRIFTSDEESHKKLINKLRDDLDSSNSHQAKIRMKHKDVFEAADALDKKHNLNISKVIMRYIQNGCMVDYAENTPFDQLRTVCHKLLRLLATEYGIVPNLKKEGAIATLLADRSFKDWDNKGKQYIILHPIMNQYLARSLEYFCYIANNTIHGKQDSSKLGNAAINILMEFIIWFFEEDIVQNRLSLLKGNGRMLYASTENNNVFDEFINQEYVVKCNEIGEYLYIDDTHIAGVGIHVQQNKISQITLGSKIRITKRIGFEKEPIHIGDVNIAFYVSAQNYEIL